MKTISVINYKGGVGKTTITSNLAAGLSQKGYKVLAIDLDPQSNLTFSFIGVDEWKKNYAENRTIRNWFNENSKINKFNDLIINPKKINQDNLNIICSHIGLINTDLELAMRISGSTNRQQKSNFVNVHNILKKGLEDIKEDNYDIVLIDCPPSFNISTRNALVASDYYIVPIKLDYLSTLGLDELNRHIKELESDYNSNVDECERYMNLQLIGVICNMVSRKGNGLIGEEQNYINNLNRSNFLTFKSMIRENKTSHASAPKDGIPVIMKKASGLTYKGVKKELENLVDEFIERVGL